MKQYPADRVRNITLLGDSGAGKTSLAEAMLFDVGVLTCMGRVEDGNTVSDYDPEERRRGISINLTMLPVEWQGYKLNFLDAPGYVDFVGEEYSAAAAADAVLIVVDAVAWVLRWAAKLPGRSPRTTTCRRIVCLNKMGRENANPNRVIAPASVFGANFVPVQVPIGAEANFKGVIDLLSRQAYVGPEAKKEAIPAALADDVEMGLMALSEAAAGDDDEFIMKSTARKADRGRDPAWPVGSHSPGQRGPRRFSDATHNIGVRPLMTLLTEVVPGYQQQPRRRSRARAGETIWRCCPTRPAPLCCSPSRPWLILMSAS